MKSYNSTIKWGIIMIPKGLPTNILTKNTRDSYKICSLIIIIIVGILNSEKCGLFKMLKNEPPIHVFALVPSFVHPPICIQS
jgi:hypothetical protein